MFAVQKIFNYIIFPPSIFILILLAALLFIKKKRGIALVLIISDILLIYFLSIEPVKNLLLAPLENYAPPVTEESADGAELIVILGGGTLENSPEEGENGSLTGDAFKRALYGLHLGGKFRLPVLSSGGKLFDGNGKGEAEITVRLLSKYNHSGIKLLKETSSRTTYENALYVKEKFNPGKVILVTSAYHMKRSLYIFRKAGVECVPAPTDYKIDSQDYNVTSFLPKSYEMDCIYKGLKEYAGMLFYMVRYR
ncbi:MAG TPA: YdcF family protein [Spirochaetota bacterium]|nr:YdcF family protein [Spirochaetota bacterium]HPJ36104.1 YdcF family protein [Spirochaetota bacterium]